MPVIADVETENPMMALPIQEKDHEVLKRWLEADEHHKGQDPNFFLVPQPGTQIFKWGRSVEDDEPLYYVKIENVARVHLQFSKDASKASNARELERGYTWLIDGLQRRGYKELVFESVYAPLIRFCKRVFGFRKSENDFIRSLR